MPNPLKLLSSMAPREVLAELAVVAWTSQSELGPVKR
jgi:hypothetical protein